MRKCFYLFLFLGAVQSAAAAPTHQPEPTDGTECQCACLIVGDQGYQNALALSCLDVDPQSCRGDILAFAPEEPEDPVCYGLQLTCATSPGPVGHPTGHGPGQTSTGWTLSCLTNQQITLFCGLVGGCLKPKKNPKEILNSEEPAELPTETLPAPRKPSEGTKREPLKEIDLGLY